jgi:small-conductance mechanosensitive channel/predicted  nucleic acid-binding Zn-ribbon protein
MTEAIWKSLTTRKTIFAGMAVVVLSLGGLWLADPDAFPIGPYTEAEPPGPALSPDDDKPAASEAERVARLQRSIEDQCKYIASLKNELENPNGEYYKTQKEFQKLDNQRAALRRAIQDLKASSKTAEAAEREAELKNLEPRWQDSLDSFNVELTEHKRLQKGIEAAERQLKESREELARLTNASPPTAANSSTGGAAAPATETAQGVPAGKAAASSSTPSVPITPYALAAAAAAPSSNTAATPQAKDSAEHVSREVELAREDAKRKQEDLHKAESQVEFLNQRIEVLSADIDETKKLLESRQKEVEDLHKDKTELKEELAQKTSAKAPEAERNDLMQRLEKTQKHHQKVVEEIRDTANHLQMLQRQLSRLQATQVRAQRDIEAKKQAANAAEAKIAWLQNPFRPRNIVHWLVEHGPRLFVIALGMFVFHRLSRLFSRRVVQFMSKGTSKRGTKKDRENRSHTLIGVFNSALSMLVLGGGSLMMLDAVGIPIVPLMGGAAVLGLAVAFGAQNLIKDYFSGFMVLLEDQYGINDVVKIGTISGLVEHISLRATVLRDLEGIVHFIPHGTIATVSNMTHGWSRALFDVGVDYKEDTDRVMEVLLELSRELRRDAAFADLILDDAEMLGVDNLADSSVIIKFFIKTRPLQQWTVKREMLRRIKKRFGELGIEIPYPHQTVHHRYDVPPPAGFSDAPPFGRVA